MNWRSRLNDRSFLPGISKPTVAILEKLRQIGGGSRFVFLGRNRDKPISNNTMLFALYRLGYKGKMTGHGFRAVASTCLNEMGFRADAIERQLDHAERDEVWGAYNGAEYLPERNKDDAGLREARRGIAPGREGNSLQGCMEFRLSWSG